MAICGVDVFAIPHVVASNQAATLADPTADPSLSIVRVDVAAFLAKVLAMPSSSWAMYAVPIVILLVTGWLVWGETLETRNCAGQLRNISDSAWLQSWRFITSYMT